MHHLAVIYVQNSKQNQTKLTKLGYSRKNPNRTKGVLGYTFLKTPQEFFGFIILPYEIPEKTSFQARKFCKVV